MFWKALFMLVCSMVVVFIFWEKLSPNMLRSWGVSANLSGFTVQRELSDQQPGQLSQETVEMVKKDAFINIVKSMPVDNQKLVDDRNFIFRSLYEPTTSPYPEVISQIVICPDEFKPKLIQHVNGTIYTAYAGERMNFGVCARDLVVYKAGYGIFNCGKKGVFEMEVFSKKDNFANLLQSFSCNGKK